MFGFGKTKSAHRNPVVPPRAILDNFRDDIAAQKEYHYAEVERLRSLIDDATQRLANHKIALEQCDAVLESVRVEEALTLAHYELALDAA